MKAIGQTSKSVVPFVVTDGVPFDRKEIVHEAHYAATEALAFFQRFHKHVVNPDDMRNAVEAFGLAFMHFNLAVHVEYPDKIELPKPAPMKAHYRELVGRDDSTKRAVTKFLVAYEVTLKQFHGQVDVWGERVDSVEISAAIECIYACHQWMLCALGKIDQVDGPLTYALEEMEKRVPAT